MLGHSSEARMHAKDKKRPRRLAFYTEILKLELEVYQNFPVAKRPSCLVFWKFGLNLGSCVLQYIVTPSVLVLQL